MLLLEMVGPTSAREKHKPIDELVILKNLQLNSDFSSRKRFGLLHDVILDTILICY